MPGNRIIIRRSAENQPVIHTQIDVEDAPPIPDVVQVERDDDSMNESGIVQGTMLYEPLQDVVGIVKEIFKDRFTIEWEDGRSETKKNSCLSKLRIIKRGANIR